MGNRLFILPILVVLLCSCTSNADSFYDESEQSSSFYDQIGQPGCFYNETTMTYELPGIPWKQSLKKTATALHADWLNEDNFDYADSVEYWLVESDVVPITIFDLPYGTGFNIYHGKCYAVRFDIGLWDVMSFEESCSYAKALYEKFCAEYGTENLKTTVVEASDDLSAWGDVNAIWESKNADGVISQLYFHTHTMGDDEDRKVALWIGLNYDKAYLDSEWGFTPYSIDNYMN